MFPTTSSRRQTADGRPQKNAAEPLPSAICHLRSQEGYTLAALIVVLTIISIIISFTVPTQWSLVMRRERERQTVYLMKQYAKGILAWERKHQGLPTSLEMMQKARNPRFLRGTGKWPMPLTGRVDDWIMVPPQAVQQQGGPPVINPNNTGLGGGIRAGTNPTAGNSPTMPGKLNPALSPKDYTGPFIAVRPNASGPSLLEFNGADDYSQWVYTLEDLKRDIMNRQAAMTVK